MERIPLRQRKEGIQLQTQTKWTSRGKRAITYIDIDIDIDKVILENIDIDMVIFENIDIDIDMVIYMNQKEVKPQNLWKIYR